MEKKKILVIEDEPSTRDFIVQAFSGHCDYVKLNDTIIQDCKVKKGLNPLYKALKKLLKQNYTDLRAIICDLGLLQREGENDYQAGCDIIKWIRSKSDEIGLPKEYLLEIPIVVYTSASDNKNHRAALNAGADDVITKDGCCRHPYGLIDRVVPRLERFDQKYDSFQFYNRKIGISYTWHNKENIHHQFVKEIALQLSYTYTKCRILYDKFEQENGRSPGDNREKFSEKYVKDCEYILVCVSKDYNNGGENSWTSVEWRKIKEIYQKDPKRIILLPIEDFDYKNVFKDVLGINNADLETIMQPSACEFLKEYNHIIRGVGKAQKEAWRDIMNNGSLKDYVKVSFEERERIIKTIEDCVTIPIIKRIEGKE